MYATYTAAGADHCTRETYSGTANANIKLEQFFYCFSSPFLYELKLEPEASINIDAM